MRRFVAILFVALLAGCVEPEAERRFDGEDAYAFVASLVTSQDGTPRPRVPGTALHAEAADWLETAMQVPGWSVSRQAFTGAQYMDLDAGSAESYRTSSTFCREPDRSELEELAFVNLVATYGASERMVWLGAHWDSKEEASQDGETPAAAVVGANDGASGIGVLLQLMHHVADGELEVPFGLGIVFFDGEDGFEDCHPLAGSIYFTATMEDGLVDRFLLLDMVGDPNARFVRESASASSDPVFLDLLWKHGEAVRPDAFTQTKKPVVDDHIPFIEQGVRSVDLIDFGRTDTGHGFPPYWHTTEDTLDKVDADMLGDIGDVVWRTLTDPQLDATL